MAENKLAGGSISSRACRWTPGVIVTGGSKDVDDPESGRVRALTFGLRGTRKSVMYADALNSSSVLQRINDESTIRSFRRYELTSMQRTRQFDLDHRTSRPHWACQVR